MLHKIRLSDPKELFLELKNRKEKGVFCYRISAYSKNVHDLIFKYFQETQKNGVIVMKGFANPTPDQLRYYQEILGSDFLPDMNFIQQSIGKWMPRMDPEQCILFSTAMHQILMNLRAQGKNDNVLKNVYIKFFCWMYYKMERVANQLGKDPLPKILYEGDLTYYELLFLDAIASTGADVLILQYHGDTEYRKIDPKDFFTYALDVATPAPFPADFTLRTIQKEIQEAEMIRCVCGDGQLTACTNAWMQGDLFSDLGKPPVQRGNSADTFYNAFVEVCGVEDKVSYTENLYKLAQQCRTDHRNLVIVNGPIQIPFAADIAKIKRDCTHNGMQLLIELAKNIQYPEKPDIQNMLRAAFLTVMSEKEKNDANTNRIITQAVYILCWISRYSHALFNSIAASQVAAFFQFAGNLGEHNAAFLQILSMLPVDVVIFHPDASVKELPDMKTLYKVHYPYSLEMERFPEDMDARIGTVAYHAEQELNTLLYQDTGIYRTQGYVHGKIITLQTMEEEIPILWDQEVRYRQGFQVIDDTVHVPVIFSKISGVKDSNRVEYWRKIRNLVTADTEVIKCVPHIPDTQRNPMLQYAVSFYKNGRLLKDKIKKQEAYPYGFLREPMQDHILEKIEQLINSKLIRGTGTNGTEYSIIAAALNLDKNILRMIQKFDFTRKNPKRIYLITEENILSLRDAIEATLLNLIGFDILFFVPTGYRCVEQYFTKPPMEEHQSGEYLYDLRVSDFDMEIQPQSWFEKIKQNFNLF